MKFQLKAHGRNNSRYPIDVEIDSVGTLSYFCGCQGFKTRRSCKHVIALLIGDTAKIDGVDPACMETMRGGLAGTALQEPLRALRNATLESSDGIAQATKAQIKALTDDVKAVIPTHAIGGTVRSESQRHARSRGRSEMHATQSKDGASGPAPQGTEESLPSELVFLDTETTGKWSQYGDQVIEIAVVAQDGSTLLDELVNPEGRQIHPEALAKHGIGAEQLQGKPTLAELSPKIAEAVQGKLVVAYNVEFDRAVLGWTRWLRGNEFTAGR